MVNGLYLYSTFLVFVTTQSALHYISFTHSHKVKCLAQGHMDRWTGGAGNRITSLPIGGRPLNLLSHSRPMYSIIGRYWPITVCCLICTNIIFLSYISSILCICIFFLNSSCIIYRNS